MLAIIVCYYYCCLAHLNLWATGETQNIDQNHRHMHMQKQSSSLTLRSYALGQCFVDHTAPHTNFRVEKDKLTQTAWELG